MTNDDKRGSDGDKAMGSPSGLLPEAPDKAAAKPGPSGKPAKGAFKNGVAINRLGPGGSLRNRPGRILGTGRGSIVPTSRG